MPGFPAAKKVAEKETKTRKNKMKRKVSWEPQSSDDEQQGDIISKLTNRSSSNNRSDADSDYSKTTLGRLTQMTTQRQRRVRFSPNVVIVNDDAITAVQGRSKHSCGDAIECRRELPNVSNNSTSADVNYYSHIIRPHCPLQSGSKRG